ncbi:MAG: glutamate-5-semialdehyde dehydrogenase [Puia sp.]|nr:glutamate-5-semialdehyde dehydrogenase [Puia sp.]
MQTIESQIIRTHQAGVHLRTATDRQIKMALKALGDILEKDPSVLIRANRKDLARQQPDDPRNDRLLLNEARIRAISNSIRVISRLPDPTGKILEKRRLENGLQVEKITVPLGVVGAIFESRPNVTFDITALCLRSRNACLLKGSSDAEYTNLAAIGLIKRSLKVAGIHPDAVTLLPSPRETVEHLFSATRYIDVIIPRGSESLIRFVRKNSLVPVIETGAGVCHVYVEKEADLEKALNIVVNAKVSRPSVCNALDTILVDQAIAPEFLKRLQPLFDDHRVEIFAEPKAYSLLRGYSFLQKATEEDFSREFISLKCAVKVVKGIDQALAHIDQYGTRHSESIVSRNKAHCERFLQEVDAAVVYTNASTRFTDGEELGLGAEIGISTQKLHARGPFALEKLITEKWLIRGNGQVRE